LWILLKCGKGAWWKLDELIARYSEAQTDCPVTYTHTADGLRRLLHGMTVRSILVDYIFPNYIPEYIRYEYKKV
jgi:hypothetical protein